MPGYSGLLRSVVAHVEVRDQLRFAAACDRGSDPAGAPLKTAHIAL
jgi:hypothetical protein